jgi:hypothetical protein
MIYAVYIIATGAAVSICDDPKQLADADLLAKKGYAVQVLDISNWDAGGAWDPATLSFLPRAPDEPEDKIALDLAVDAATLKDGDLFRYDAAKGGLVAVAAEKI